MRIGTRRQSAVHTFQLMDMAREKVNRFVDLSHAIVFRRLV